MAALIKFKRGIESAVKQSVLDEGEPAFTIDTHKLFVGDGTTPGGHLIGSDGLSYGFGYSILYFDEDFEAIPYVLHAVDTTQSIINIDLPQGPNNGAEVRIIDVANNFDVNKVVLNGNGNKIEGSYSTYDLTETGSYILYFGLNGTEKTWFVVKVIGQNWFDSGANDSWNIVYTDTSVNANNKESILADTTNNTITINTPSNPILGQKFQVQDYNNTWGNNKVTVNTTENFKCSPINSLDFSENGMVVTFIYDVCPNGDFSWTVKIGRTLTPQDVNVDNWYQNGANDHDVIRWNSVLNQWTVGSMIIGDWKLSDYYSGNTGQILIYNESLGDWVVNDLTQIFGSFYTGTNGQILVYNSTLEIWESKDLIEVLNNFYAGNDGDLLIYNGTTNSWELGSYNHSDLSGISGQLVNIDTGVETGLISETNPATVIRSIVTDDEGHLVSADIKEIIITGYALVNHSHGTTYADYYHNHSHELNTNFWAPLVHEHSHSDIRSTDGTYRNFGPGSVSCSNDQAICQWSTNNDGHLMTSDYSIIQAYSTHWYYFVNDKLQRWGYIYT